MRFVLLISMFLINLYSKNILILNSYHSTFSWTKNQNDNIIKQLKRNIQHKIIFYVEYMDTK